MADNYLNKTVLGYWYNRLKTVFASQTDLDALDTKVDEIIAEGGEPNVIETVKVNGSALTPDANKAVNVEVPEDLSDLTNTGNDPYATEGYVDQNGGKIDKIKVNGTEQTITNKEVDLNVVEGASTRNNTVDLSGGTGAAAWTAEVPTITWVSGQSYQNATQVQTAIDNALEDITEIDFQVVQALPATGEKGIIYLVSNSGTSPNIYDEYIWISGDPTGYFEKIGTTEVDLSGYWSKSELVAITTAEIDEIMGS